MTCPPLELRSPAIRLDASIVPWDTESFGVPVAQVDKVKVTDSRVAREQAEPLARWLRDGGVRLAACRLGHQALAESFLLETLGFKFVEMVYAMRHDLSGLPGAPGDDALVWVPAARGDLAELQAMAAQAFVTGRWNVDWRVGPQLAGRRYADWVKRSFDDPRHRLLAAQVDGALAGFFIIEDRADGSTYWHLTAVAEAFQGRGLGRRMWTSMLQRQASEGRRFVDTTIAARNIPVVNLYARLGWRFVENQMTFHWAHDDWTGRLPGGVNA